MTKIIMKKTLLFEEAFSRFIGYFGFRLKRIMKFDKIH